MIKVLFVCTAGMSTSLLVEKVKKEAEARGIAIEVNAVGEAEARTHALDIDVMLLGPQVRYLEKSMRTLIDGKNVALGVVEMIAYGTMNGAKVLDQILALKGN